MVASKRVLNLRGLLFQYSLCRVVLMVKSQKVSVFDMRAFSTRSVESF